VLLGDAFFGSDRALADNPETLAIVRQFAADQDLFFEKFSEVLVKLSWLGVDPSVPRRGI
jgi:catalase (peroxidase I)